MIALENVSVRQGAFTLGNISLEIAAGEYGVLMGRTGSGKTTLLEAICGLRPVAAGTIRLMGRDVTRLAPAARGVGYVPQDAALFSTMTVRDHLAFALAVRRWSPAAISERIEPLARMLGVDRLMDRLPRGLSGGEASARLSRPGLIHAARVLLLDEPFNALDDDTRNGIYDLLRSIRRQLPITVLHVTHSRAEAECLADRVFELDASGVCQRSQS